MLMSMMVFIYYKFLPISKTSLHQVENVVNILWYIPLHIKFQILHILKFKPGPDAHLQYLPLVACQVVPTQSLIDTTEPQQDIF